MHIIGISKEILNYITNQRLFCGDITFKISHEYAFYNGKPTGTKVLVGIQ